jgi:hypothetical protein
MSEWREWDFPPDRHRVSRRSAPRVVDLHMRVERNGAVFRPRKQSLATRFWSAYAVAMWQLAKIIVACVITAYVLAAFGLLVVILKL